MKRVDESAKTVDSFYRSAIGRIIGRDDDTLSNTPARLRTADTCSGRSIPRFCASRLWCCYVYDPTLPPAIFRGLRPAHVRTRITRVVFSRCLHSLRLFVTWSADNDCQTHSQWSGKTTRWDLDTNGPRRSWWRPQMCVCVGWKKYTKLGSREDSLFLLSSYPRNSRQEKEKSVLHVENNRDGLQPIQTRFKISNLYHCKTTHVQRGSNQREIVFKAKCFVGHGLKPLVHYPTRSALLE